METVLGQIGALYRCQSLKRDITELAKYPPENQTSSYQPVDAVHGYFSSVAT